MNKSTVLVNENFRSDYVSNTKRVSHTPSKSPNQKGHSQHNISQQNLSYNNTSVDYIASSNLTKSPKSV